MKQQRAKVIDLASYREERREETSGNNCYILGALGGEVINALMDTFTRADTATCEAIRREVLAHARATARKYNQKGAIGK